MITNRLGCVVEQVRALAGCGAGRRCESMLLALLALLALLQDAGLV